MCLKKRKTDAAPASDAAPAPAPLKTINVVGAMIISNNTILATQRGYGDYEGGWEFPGGKIEPGETPEEALAREIREELLVNIEVGDLFYTVEYDYPKFHLSMRCYLCSLPEGHITLTEHEAAKWLTAEDIESVEWLPADLEVVEAFKTAGILK